MSSNKLNLKDYVLQQDPTHKPQHSHPQSGHQIQQKTIKNQRKSSNRQCKKLKLNTLPCEQIQKDNNEMFLFRSTWEDDMEHLKQQMKGCTSPTFATQILSHGNNHSSLFPYTDQINENQPESIKRTRVSNSRSKSKQQNKSLQKFIGDSVSNHRPSGSTVQKASVPGHQSQVTISSNQQEMYMYELKKLQSVSNELKRQNKKLQDKCKQLKERCELLEEINGKSGNEQINAKRVNLQDGNLMSNEELLQRMKNESFWKFYLKAEKLIKASMSQNNQQSFTSPINFMKQLQALREMSSKMKKQNSSLKTTNEQRQEQVQRMKDRLNVQQAQVEQMRLKSVAYQSLIRRLKQQVSRNAKEMEKVAMLSVLQQKLTQKVMECSGLSKQVSSLTGQLQQQKLLNSECQKQRLSTKKKCQQLNDQLTSLNKQLLSIKTSYNLLEIQKQQLSANKKQLIQKEKLKEQVFRLEKEINSITQLKQQEINRIKLEWETTYGKEIQVKESRVKELDSKVEQILGNITELQTKNSVYAQENSSLSCEISTTRKENTRLINENRQLSKQLNQMQQNTSHLSQQLNCIKTQYQARIDELSFNVKTVTQKLNEQAESLLNQENLIQQLKKKLSEKEELLKAKQNQFQKLKASLGTIKQQQQSSPNNPSHLQQQASQLQQKLNQALQMYQQVHNKKVQLQLQLQYAQQQVQNLSHHLQKLSSSHQYQQNPSFTHNNQQSPPRNDLTEDTLQMVENLLTIKEEIIKKILIFCPQDYKTLLVEYIYYGDMIKEKYFHIINAQLQQGNPQEQYREPYEQDNDDNHHQSQDQSDLQPEDSNFYQHSQTTRNHNNLHHSNARYNQTKPYQSRKPHYQDSSSESQSQLEELQQPNSPQDEINYLVDQFLKIGNIIDHQTRIHYQNPNPKDRKKHLPGLQIHSSKEKETQKDRDFRRSKEKEMQQSKNLLNQLNRKIQKVKQNNINNQNSFHYQPASNFDKKPISKQYRHFTEDQQNRNFIQDQQIRHFAQDKKYPSESIQRANRQPLQVNEQKNQQNLSRPLFTGKDMKPKNPNITRNPYQEQQRQTRQQNSMQRSSMMTGQQTPYQKGSHGQSGRDNNNFNHGVMSKLNMMKISDRIRQ